ncbi:hypothetical protein LSTR_LSTR009969 [Laodelphax striatellus]|uniref:Uncharacterized protein n=1 Tax=Laodelphax striatellus TaxID=195883 RepID=A0A482XIP2_LAOST|nr:hypothetical protein LSTR_LSTR009969 [Laodelphax striatellus]
MSKIHDTQTVVYHSSASSRILAARFLAASGRQHEQRLTARLFRCGASSCRAMPMDARKSSATVLAASRPAAVRVDRRSSLSVSDCDGGVVDKVAPCTVNACVGEVTKCALQIMCAGQTSNEYDTSGEPRIPANLEYDTCRVPQIPREQPSHAKFDCNINIEPQITAKLENNTHREPQIPAKLENNTHREPQFPANLEYDTCREPQFPANLKDDTCREPQFPANIEYDTCGEPQFPANLEYDTCREPQFPREPRIPGQLEYNSSREPGIPTNLEYDLCRESQFPTEPRISSKLENNTHRETRIPANLEYDPCREPQFPGEPRIPAELENNTHREPRILTKLEYDTHRKSLIPAELQFNNCREQKIPTNLVYDPCRESQLPKEQRIPAKLEYNTHREPKITVELENDTHREPRITAKLEFNSFRESRIPPKLTNGNSVESNTDDEDYYSFTEELNVEKCPENSRIVNLIESTDRFLDCPAPHCRAEMTTDPTIDYDYRLSTPTIPPPPPKPPEDVDADLGSSDDEEVREDVRRCVNDNNGEEIGIGRDTKTVNVEEKRVLEVSDVRVESISDEENEGEFGNRVEKCVTDNKRNNMEVGKDARYYNVEEKIDLQVGDAKVKSMSDNKNEGELGNVLKRCVSDQKRNNIEVGRDAKNNIELRRVAKNYIVKENSCDKYIVNDVEKSVEILDENSFKNVVVRDKGKRKWGRKRPLTTVVYCTRINLRSFSHILKAVEVGANRVSGVLIFYCDCIVMYFD